MESKITLSFNTSVINKAKKFAQEKKISVSRLVELLLDKATSTRYKTLEDLPVADWVSQLVAEEPAVYITKKRTSKSIKDEYYSSKK